MTFIISHNLSLTAALINRQCWSKGEKINLVVHCELKLSRDLQPNHADAVIVPFSKLKTLALAKN